MTEIIWRRHEARAENPVPNAVREHTRRQRIPIIRDHLRQFESTAALDTISGRAEDIDYVDAFHEKIWSMAKAPMLEGQFHFGFLCSGFSMINNLVYFLLT